MEKTISSHLINWLGVPPSVSNVALYGKGQLEFPLSSLVEEYKCAKLRLQMIFADSKDEAVKASAPSQRTRKKWCSKDVTQQAISDIKHKELVGQIQHGSGWPWYGRKTNKMVQNF